MADFTKNNRGPPWGAEEGSAAKNRRGGGWQRGTGE